MPRVPTVTPRGAVIQDLRLRSGLSRKELGKKASCGQEMIRLVELDRRAGRLLVCRIARALQVDVDELIVPDDDEEDVAA